MMAPEFSSKRDWSPRIGEMCFMVKMRALFDSSSKFSSSPVMFLSNWG
jgi:hypothetical protein